MNLISIFRLFTVCLILFVLTDAAAQYNRSIDKLFAGSDYKKLRLTLDKKSAKDSLNPLYSYYYAKYFLAEKNSAERLDSAYFFSLKARDSYRRLDKKTRAKWVKKGFSADALGKQKHSIEKLAFDQAKELHTEEGYQRFIDQFGQASQVGDAMRARNKLAFEKAGQANSYEAFKEFLNKYPDAEQAQEAYEIFELKLYESKTGAQTANAYLSFIREHPDNRYVIDAHEKYFRLYTMDLEPEHLQHYLKELPTAAYVKQVKVWIAYQDILRGSIPADYNYVFKTLNKTLFPVLKQNKFQFIDQSGETIIRTKFDSLDEDFLCEFVIDQLYIKGFRAGKPCFSKLDGDEIEIPGEEIESFVPGVFVFKKSNKYGLYHIEEFEILPPVYDELKPMGKFVAFRKEKQWGLVSYTGLEILPPKYRDINWLGNGLISCETSDGLQLVSEDAIRPAMLRRLDIPLFRANDAIAYSEKLAMIRANGKWGMADGSLHFAIPLKYESILRQGEFLQASGNEKTQIFSPDGKALYGPSDGKMVFNPLNKAFMLEELNGRALIHYLPLLSDSSFEVTDSAHLYSGNYLVSWNKGQRYLRASTNKPFKIPANAKVELLQSGTGQYFQITEPGKKSALHHQEGKLVLTAVYDEIYFADSLHFKIRQGKFFGLADLSGKITLPPKYDGIVSIGNGYFSVLEKGKFGVFGQGKLIIKPQFDANCKLLNAGKGLFTATKSGKTGIVDRFGKWLINPQFGAVEPWAPDQILVEKGGLFFICSNTEATVVSPAFQSQQMILQNENQWMLLSSEGKRGIWVKGKGMVLDMIYDQISIIGEEQKLIFTAIENDNETYNIRYFDLAMKPVYEITLTENMYEKLLCAD